MKNIIFNRNMTSKQIKTIANVKPNASMRINILYIYNA